MNGILAIHSNEQDAQLDFWRIFIPSDANTKEKVMQELHSTPYRHPEDFGLDQAVILLERDNGECL